MHMLVFIRVKNYYKDPVDLASHSQDLHNVPHETPEMSDLRRPEPTFAM